MTITSEILHILLKQHSDYGGVDDIVLSRLLLTDNGVRACFSTLFF